MKKEASDSAVFTLIHEFNAPKKMVFEAFSDAEALGEWWGPVECRNTVLKLDFRIGGAFHFKMERHGEVNYGRLSFIDIQPHDLLEFSNAFTDAQGRVIRAPFDIPLPREIFYRMVFTEHHGITMITMTGQPMDAGSAEIAAFTSIHDGMKNGFGASFMKLSAYLGRSISG